MFLIDCVLPKYKCSKHNHHQNTNGHNTNIIENMMNAKRNILQVFPMAQLPFALHEDHSQIVTQK
jgi:hypothetical protein